MRKCLILLALMLLSMTSVYAIIVVKNGDINSDTIIDLSDPVYLSRWLFDGGPSPICKNSDVNDDGFVDVVDVVYLLAFLFDSGPPPVPEFVPCF